MNRPIRRLAVILFTVFALLAGTLTYQQVIAGPDYRDDPRNVRVALSRTGRERGPIVTADGVVAAISTPDRLDPRLFTRTYPQGELYAHVIGYNSLLFGDGGLEDEYASTLESGRNSTISGLLTVLSGGDLRAQGLRLTIHHELQQAAIAALGDRRGAVVALDPRSGAVLALVSVPSFDPNVLIGADADADGRSLETAPFSPLTNRAVDALYAPGSAFKVVTTSGVLEGGAAGPETEFPNPAVLELPGTSATIRNADREPCGPGETVSLETAFVRSCNTTFGALVLQVGARVLVDAAEAFGFNRTLPFDVPVVPSRIPDVESMDQAAAAQNGLGERDVRVTPLHMALIAAAVANRGTAMTPYLVDEVFDADGEVIRRTTPSDWQTAVSPATADVLTDLMERAVTSGTGRRAAVPGVRVAGKTGTPEVVDGPPHAWFIGFAPVDASPNERQIAVAVFVESGSAGENASGSTVAAPIAQQIFASWLGVSQ